MGNKEKNPNHARGRENAPGLDHTHTFVNDAGEARIETQRWFLDEGKALGFRPQEGDEPEGQTGTSEEAGSDAVS